MIQYIVQIFDLLNSIYIFHGNWIKILPVGRIFSYFIIMEHIYLFFNPQYSSNVFKKSIFP